MAERKVIRNAVLMVDGISYPMRLTPKEYSTGSIGYFLSGKVNGGDLGKGFQVSGNIVQIGSKNQ